MRDFKIDPNNGLVEIDGVAVNVLLRLDLAAYAKLASVEFRELLANGYVNYSLEVMCCNESFILNLSYINDALYSAYKVWVTGESYGKGWDASESDIVSDKEALTTIFENYFHIEPHVRGYNFNAFEFSWGNITVGCSLQNVVVTVGLHWNNRER